MSARSTPGLVCDAKTRRSRGFAFVLATSFTLLCLGPAVASAETSPEIADRMFREAKKAMDGGDYPRACPLFEESQRLDPGGGTLLNLALCQEKLGKLATAQKSFELAAERARADGRPDRLGEAHAHLAALAPRVPSLTLTPTLTVGPKTFSGRVLVDGRVLAPDEIGSKLALDPGQHVVRLEPQGALPVTRTLDLKEGTHEQMAVDNELSMLPPPPTPAAPASPAAPAATTPSSPTVPPLALLSGQGSERVSPARPEASFSTASWISFGVAAGGVGTATITGLMALSARSAYAEKCFDDRGYCVDMTARESGQRARSLAWVSTISLGVGVVALWTGLLLPRRYPVTVATTGTGLLLRGSF